MFTLPASPTNLAGRAQAQGPPSRGPNTRSNTDSTSKTRRKSSCEAPRAKTPPALGEFYWNGSDLHSQRRYLALRLRFRGEPYGYLIAHDIHDAVRESRKRSRKHKKEATKQARKIKWGQGTHTTTSCEEETSTHAARKDEPDTKTIQAKAKRKLSEILRINPRAPPQPSPPPTSSSSSRTATVRIAAVPPPDTEDPFQDPIPGFKKAKPKTEKAIKKKEKKEEKKVEKKEEKKEKKMRRRRKTIRSFESQDSVQDPFRDPEPMRLIDADDFRLESSEDTS
ncbi:hypothetical protein F5B17DRAFT_446915 [Nemania serpens]|nr:hypothetical protein F5B17DRAFT_446915 [Nemania serpens]